MPDTEAPGEEPGQFGVGTAKITTPLPPVPPLDTTTPPDTGLRTTIEETTGVSRTPTEITPLTAEEAGRQRILNLQKKVDEDVEAVVVTAAVVPADVAVVALAAFPEQAADVVAVAALPVVF